MFHSPRVGLQAFTDLSPWVVTFTNASSSCSKGPACFMLLFHILKLNRRHLCHAEMACGSPWCPVFFVMTQKIKSQMVPGIS